MKMIATGTDAPALDYNQYIANCTRNAACEPAFSAPLPGIPYLQLYVDFGQYQPATYEIILQNTCSQWHTAQLFPGNYVVGQTPEGNWYGVFKYFKTPTAPPVITNFVVWLSAYLDTPAGLIERTWFSQQIQIDPCARLMKLKACYPEGSTDTGFDHSGLYYGLPVGDDYLGMEGIRYYHIAYVRQGKVRDLPPKATFKTNLVRNFRTTLEETWQLEHELVPKWYKDLLLAIYTRGAVQVDDGTPYLVSDLAFEGIEEKDFRWKAWAQLKKVTRLYFGCDDSVCSDCCSPTVLDAIAIGGFGPVAPGGLIDYDSTFLLDSDGGILLDL
jgi:hypothetical protein